jgi:hypothetical protein
MGFFSGIKKAFSAVSNTVKNVVNTVKNAVAPKATTPKATTPSIPAPTQQQLTKQFQSDVASGKTKISQPATTSTQQTSPGNPLQGVSQPPQQVLQTAMTGVNPNTPEGVGKSKNSLQTLTIQPGQNEQVAAKTFDPEVENAIRNTTGAITSTALTAATLGTGGGAMFAAGTATKVALNAATKTAAKMAAKNAANQMLKVGTKGLSNEARKAISSAGMVAVNGATTIATKSWLTKLAGALANPNFVVGALVGAIGSYPFAGFIKEEALQTIGFAVSVAHQNQDVEGMAAALALQQDVLNDDLWEGIMAAVPYANVLAKLEEFYEAAKLKNTIDTKIFEDLKISIATGETEDAKWARLNAEKAQQERDNIDYYNQERMKLVLWEQEARAAANAAQDRRERREREEEAAFWAEQKRLAAEQELLNAQAIANFWLAYKKELAKMQQNNQASNLKFGLL